MPPSNTPNPTSLTNGHARKRTATSVVPAIPLALSRPRASRVQPKPESEAKGGAESETPVVSSAGVVTTSEEAVTTDTRQEEGTIQANGTTTPELGYQNGGGEPDTPASAAPSTNESSVINNWIDEDSRPSTASTDEVTTAVNTPELSRKPTERFDMRQIRTELPPAFVPSAAQHTPRSNDSSQSNRPPQMPSHAHPSHPSTGSIVFGGQDSSSSPVPPQSANSAYNTPSFPSYGATSAPMNQAIGHAHHTSEPNGPRMFRPAGQQPIPPWNARHSYGQQHMQPGPPNHHDAHMPLRLHQPEAFTPVDSPHVNGKLSRSASLASSTTGDQSGSAQAPHPPHNFDTSQSSQEPRRAFPPPPQARQFHQQMPPPPPPQFPAPDIASQMDNADALRQHVLSQFGNPNTADCSITFVEDLQGASQTFSGHKLIVNRSPRLMQILSREQGSCNEVTVPLAGRYMKLSALNDALKYLYGGALLQLDNQRPTSSAGERSLVNIQRMEHALSYVAAGSWLGLPQIAGRGVEVAGSILHWDTIPTALTFALDGGLGQMWTIDDGSEDPFSASSSDDSLGRPEIIGRPTYDPYSTAVLQRILDFTIHVFPTNFYLDSTAPQLEACPRLPSLPQASAHGSRPSVSDPRLSQIRFGEVPVGPSHTTTMISSIFLSLPFQLLKASLEHFIFATRLGPETAASIMRQVVGERERRRTKTQQARTAGNISGKADTQLLQNLYWEEFVEVSPPLKVGFRLARRRTGIDTPLSSGPE